MCSLDRHTDVLTSGTVIEWTSGSSRLTTLTLACRRRRMRRCSQPASRICVQMLHINNDTIATLHERHQNDVQNDP